MEFPVETGDTLLSERVFKMWEDALIVTNRTHALYGSTYFVTSPSPATSLSPLPVHSGYLSGTLNSALLPDYGYVFHPDHVPSVPSLPVVPGSHPSAIQSWEGTSTASYLGGVRSGDSLSADVLDGMHERLLRLTTYASDSKSPGSPLVTVDASFNLRLSSSFQSYTLECTTNYDSDGNATSGSCSAAMPEGQLILTPSRSRETSSMDGGNLMDLTLEISRTFGISHIGNAAVSSSWSGSGDTYSSSQTDRHLMGSYITGYHHFRRGVPANDTLTFTIAPSWPGPAPVSVVAFATFRVHLSYIRRLTSTWVLHDASGSYSTISPSGLPAPEDVTVINNRRGESTLVAVPCTVDSCGPDTPFVVSLSASDLVLRALTAEWGSGIPGLAPAELLSLAEPSEIAVPEQTGSASVDSITAYKSGFDYVPVVPHIPANMHTTSFSHTRGTSDGWPDPEYAVGSSEAYAKIEFSVTRPSCLFVVEAPVEASTTAGGS